MPDFAYWFSPIRTDKEEFLMSGPVGNYRGQRAGKDIKAWQEKHNLEIYSPHKFRHGNAVYSIKRAETISQLKAVSQNLMHSSITITDKYYSLLDNHDIKKNISTLNSDL